MAPTSKQSSSRLPRFLQPFASFVRVESLGGNLLILASIVALVWANSEWSDQYLALWEKPIAVGIGDWVIREPSLIWINDLLMAFFFLLVGMEIKRELLVGELNAPSKAFLPVFAALGGMIVPALIFYSITHGGPESRGWGVPMATDIAFALGVMRLVSNRVPPGLFVFLAALAIIDDLGAILVIAIFYSSAIHWGALGFAALITAVLVLMNRGGIRRPGLYFLVGLPLWVALYLSGIHATIAGVIVGVCMPAGTRFGIDSIVAGARSLLGKADDPRSSGADVEGAVADLRTKVDGAQSPLERLEHAMQPYVGFVIVPLFALANAGVVLKGASPSLIVDKVSLGVILGLFVGKPIGVIGMTLLAVKLGIARLPSGVTGRHLLGAGMLAGIGFTMSLFVAGLAYETGSLLHTEAKVGILAGSIISGIAGLIVLRTAPAPSDRAG